jgi:hypothetical protein
LTGRFVVFLCGALLVPVVGAAPAFAQRHGRADSAQNYAKGIPEPTLTNRTPGSTIKLRRQQLSGYPAISETIVGPARGRVQSLSGVAISAVAGGSSLLASGQMLEVHYGFFRTKRVRFSDLAPDTTPLIVEKVNDRLVNRTSLFYVLIRTTKGDVIRLKAVREIRTQAQ